MLVMSREQDYFPPSGTKFTWGEKSLNYSPWRCNLIDQKYPKLWTWPARIDLIVDLVNGKYKWTVEVTPFKGGRYVIKGQSICALKACLAAEKAGEKELKKMFPKWVITALKNGWRSIIKL